MLNHVPFGKRKAFLILLEINVVCEFGKNCVDLDERELITSSPFSLFTSHSAHRIWVFGAINQKL